MLKNKRKENHTVTREKLYVSLVIMYMDKNVQTLNILLDNWYNSILKKEVRTFLSKFRDKNVRILYNKDKNIHTYYFQNIQFI